jgi:uncharacterized membrane protein
MLVTWHSFSSCPGRLVLVSVLQRMRERFWFVPAVLSAAAFVLAEALIALDRAFGELGTSGLLGAVLYRAGAAGSRDVLGVIATSSLAVAGTTFSITIAVMALTSSSYGPRLVRNFMADPGNQVVLGVYVATFLYSLLVMRAVRVIGDPLDASADIFVPHLAVNVAIAFAVLNVAVLVYFIHHISDSIQIATIAARVRSDLRSTVDSLYPESIGLDEQQVEQGREEIELPDRLETDGVALRAERPGYLQSVREEELVRVAARHDILVAMKVRPGGYLIDDTVFALVYPPERASEQALDGIRGAVIIGDARSPHQDVDFAVQQLTELAVRALSSGINDPYTAVNALDDLSAGLVPLASREQPSAGRYDTEGVLRVHAPHADVVELVNGVLDRMRWYAATHVEVMTAALRLAELVGASARQRELRARLRTQVHLMTDAVAAAGNQDHDVDAFRARADDVVRGLARVHR